jgi:hypothetical protein
VHDFHDDSFAGRQVEVSPGLLVCLLDDGIDDALDLLGRDEHECPK